MNGHRPNILLITTDQQHHAVLGVHNPVVQTPHLDRLAAEGALFERAYCPNPTCSPSRASIITGKYPSSHGCWAIGTKLDEHMPTLGGLLAGAGYATTLIGKAHFQPLASTPAQTSLECPPTLRDLDFWREFHGPYYGFDHIELARNHANEAWAGQHYALWLEEHGLRNWRDHFNGEHISGTRTWTLPEELHYSAWTSERSVAAIERAVATGTPFFCWTSFQDPHPPYLAPTPWASMYDPADVVVPGRHEPGEFDHMPPWFAKTQEAAPDFGEWQETPHLNHGFTSHLVDEEELRRDIAVYYGMTSLVDANVGRILTRLDELGVVDDTIVVFTSDHGHFLGQHGLVAKGPFHYEDLLRVPLLVRHPGRVPAGARRTALQSLVDLAPTLLTAAGVPVPLDMQGVDQLPVWTGGEASARDHVLVENRHQPTRVHLRTYVDARYKLTLYRDQPWGELFDLETDPDERHNRFDDPAYADVRAELLHSFANADLRRETSLYARIAVA